MNNNPISPYDFLEEEQQHSHHLIKYNQSPVTDEITKKLLMPKQLGFDDRNQMFATTELEVKRNKKGQYKEMTLTLSEPDFIEKLYKDRDEKDRKHRTDLIQGGKMEIDFFKDSAKRLQSASKFFDFVMIKLSETGVFQWTDEEFENKAPAFFDKALEFSLAEYFELLGKKDRKTMMGTTRIDVEILKRISFSFTSNPNKKNARNWGEVKLFGGTAIIPERRSVFQMKINSDFIRLLRQYRYGDTALFLYYDVEALKTNINKNPLSYPLCKKLVSHRRINIHTEKNLQMKISVKTLYDYCQLIPRYEKVMEEGRQVSQRIIEPFNRDMNALSSSFDWEYIGEAPKTFQEWIEADINIFWKYRCPTEESFANRKKLSAPKKENKDKQK